MGRGGGYLDNRAGDRSTMAAVFSIRHYLIDRVAGLIVSGGYFRAAFVWGSAIPPPPSLPRHPSSLLNTPSPYRGPVFFLVWKGSRPFMWPVICFPSAEGKVWLAAGAGPQTHGEMEREGKKGRMLGRGG